MKQETVIVLKIGFVENNKFLKLAFLMTLAMTCFAFNKGCNFTWHTWQSLMAYTLNSYQKLRILILSINLSTYLTYFGNYGNKLKQIRSENICLYYIFS